MKVDIKQSIYRESPEARHEFDRMGLKRCRTVLRRLQFLESQIRESGGLAGGAGVSGGAAWAEWEADALEWLLDEVGFLAERKEDK